MVGRMIARGYGRIINVADAYADSRFQAAIDKHTGYHTRCILNVPLQDNEDCTIGVLQLLNKKTGTFDDRDELVARSLAAQCAVAIQRTQLTHALLLKQRLDEEVSLAREIQMSTLPTVMPDVPGPETLRSDLDQIRERFEEEFVKLVDALATATTKTRSKKSSSGVDARSSSAGSRATIGTVSPVATLLLAWLMGIDSGQLMLSGQVIGEGVGVVCEDARQFRSIDDERFELVFDLEQSLR